MQFKDEMIKIFHQVLQGEIEIAPWEEWWHTNIKQLKATLSGGAFLRIKPATHRPGNYPPCVKVRAVFLIISIKKASL